MLDNKLLEELKIKKDKLEKKDIDLIICDFDDTIFSTSENIKKDYRKWRRWDEWNAYIIENNLIDTIINDLYINKKFPNTISSKLRENHDLILTAGIEEFQIEKLKATNLNHINMVVVKTGKDKIFETLNYVVNTLWFIPHKITIYEDRPEYFIEHRELIENLLWCSLEIMFVEMIDNESDIKITPK